MIVDGWWKRQVEGSGRSAYYLLPMVQTNTPVESNATMPVRLTLAPDQPTQAWSWELVVVPRELWASVEPFHHVYTDATAQKHTHFSPCSTRPRERVYGPLRMVGLQGYLSTRREARLVPAANDRSSA